MLSVIQLEMIEITFEFRCLNFFHFRSLKQVFLPFVKHLYSNWFFHLNYDFWFFLEQGQCEDRFPSTHLLIMIFFIFYFWFLDSDFWFLTSDFWFFLQQGQGEHRFPSTHYDIAMWDQGLRHGPAVYYHPNGGKEECTYVEGYENGPSTVHFAK